MTEKTLAKRSRDEKFEEIIEPEDFFIITEKSEKFVINSVEEANDLFERLKNVKYNEKLAKFILNTSHNTKYLTKK